MNLTLKQVEDECCSKGLRLTKQLKIVLNVIYNSNDHPTADIILKRAYLLSKSISAATVYRAVRKLVDLGIVAKHDFGLGKFHYEIVTHHHHHLIDTVTGRVIEFHSEELEGLKKKIARNLGFELVDHRLDMYVVPIREGAHSSAASVDDQHGSDDEGEDQDEENDDDDDNVDARLFCDV